MKLFLFYNKTSGNNKIIVGIVVARLVGKLDLFCYILVPVLVINRSVLSVVKIIVDLLI